MSNLTIKPNSNGKEMAILARPVANNVRKRMAERKIRLRHVSEIAGVNDGQIRRVLDGKWISIEHVQRIMAAFAEMGLV